METDSPAPVFVAGYMRSGTTLLHNVLGHHPDAYFVYGDADFFGKLPLIRRAFPDLGDDETLKRLIAAVLRGVDEQRGLKKDDFRSPPEFDQTETPREVREAIWDEAREWPRRYGRVYRVVFEHLARRAGKRYWVKKALDYTAYLDEMLRDMPRARFVQAVRDPRDVLASKKSRRANALQTDRFSQEEKQRKHVGRRYDPFWDAFSWKLANRVAQSPGEGERFHAVRYEDLVQRPEESAREMCAFLGWSFAPQMLEVTYRNSSVEEKRSDSSKRSKSTGIRSDSVGRWRGVLSGADVAICQYVLKKEMQRYGYEKVPVALAEKAQVPARLVRSAAELVERLHSKWRVGGKERFTNMLITYAKRLQSLLRA